MTLGKSSGSPSSEEFLVTYKSNWSEECLMQEQGPKELVREYYTDKLRLIERSNPDFSEKEKVRALHKGFREEIKDKLTGQL